MTDEQILENKVNAEEKAMERLSSAFETSAKRWELIVYPSLFAFIILASYGFYLIYNLSRDMHYMAISVDTNMSVLSETMQNVSENMGQLTANVRTMTISLDSIDNKVETLGPILANMDSMDKSMKSLTNSTNSMSYAAHGMQRDMSRLNRNYGRPMSFMNTFMPW